jgi:Asp-tRNA(Asn)/Glu-tRNA(Gln) amidotransferase C subunit
MKNKDVKATIANLTFTVGQLEEIKSNINDTIRYIKQNTEWDTSETDSKSESPEDESAIAQ